MNVFKMNEYQKALNTIGNALNYAYNNAGEEPPMNEIYDAMFSLRELVNKAESLEWIPVEERLPEEHESIFSKMYGKNERKKAFWKTSSKYVLATIEYSDGTRIVKTSHTIDGEWADEKRNSCCKVVAWMSFPEPYKG